MRLDAAKNLDFPDKKCSENDDLERFAEPEKTKTAPDSKKNVQAEQNGKVLFWSRILLWSGFEYFSWLLFKDSIPNSSAELSLRPPPRRLAWLTPKMKRLLAFIFAVFLVVIACIRAISLYEWRQDIEATSRAALTLSTTRIILTVDRLGSEKDGNGNIDRETLQKILLDFRVAGLVNKNADIAIVNDKGTIIAASGMEPVLDKNLHNLLQADGDALLTLGDSAGVMEVMIDEQSALAAYALTDDGQYGVFVMLERQKMLSDWRRTVSLNIMLSVVTVVLSLAVLYAYFNQFARARDADQLATKLQQRIDTAMMRGRCGLWDWDIVRGRIYWSYSMYEMLGFKPCNALLSIDEVAKIFRKSDLDLYLLAEQVLRGERKHIDIYVPMRNATDNLIWMRLRAQVSEGEEPHLVGIAFDVSEERQFAEETAQADMRIRDAIENISESFVLWNAQGQLVMSNSKFREYAGLPEHILQPGVKRQTIEAMARPALNERRLVTNSSGNATFERELGNGKWLKVSERRTKDGGFVSVGTDISELKQQQKILYKKQQEADVHIRQLQHSRREQKKRADEVTDLNTRLLAEKRRAESANKAKSEFLSNMSHELRTPLNAIKGFSEMMVLETLGPLGNHAYQGYVNDIFKSSEHLLNLIDDTLKMAKVESGRFSIECKKQDIAPIVEETVRIMAFEAEQKHITFKVKKQLVIPVEVDGRAIRQVMLNLLSNAVKFTQAGGKIMTRVHKSGGALLITIADSGIGIDRADIARLGQPFEQVANQFTKTHAGSGLGLAISRSLVELHGGRLRIFSRKGKGTIISLRIPT